MLGKKNTIASKRRKMRKYGILTVEKFKIKQVRDQEIENLIQKCRYWATEVLKEIPDDEEAMRFKDFPDNM